MPQQISRQIQVLGPEDTLLRLLLVVTIILGLLARRRIFLWIETRLAPLAARLRGKGALLISSASQVIAAIAVPLVLWAHYLFVAALTNFYNPAFVVFGMLLLAWTQYELVTSVARELVLRPLLDIPPEHRCYLFRIARLLAVYGIFINVLLKSAAKLGALSDAVALYRWLFEFSLIVLLAVVLLRRRAVMALLSLLKIISEQKLGRVWKPRVTKCVNRRAPRTVLLAAVARSRSKRHQYEDSQTVR